MILDDLKKATLERVEASKKVISPEELREMLKDRPEREPFIFEKALAKEGLAYICEVKKASPSKGIIAEDFPYLEIAKEYEAAGADCISVLTEPRYFLGDIRYLKEIRAVVDTPLLRKDFTCDEYMITEAAVNGADAILLIAAILDDGELKDYFSKANELGLSAIFEAHDGREIERCLKAGARIVGVNNRDLKDFSVDIGNSGRLREMVPEGVLFVAESGISGPEDVKAVKRYGANACLIGETLMKSSDKKAMLRKLDGAED